MEQAQWQIVVAEKGWVFAGRVHRESDQLVIADAWNVRRWSLKTLDGLGGLAMRGPGAAENDVLDRMPTTRVHVLGAIAIVDCDDAAWSAWFSGATAPTAPKETKR